MTDASEPRQIPPTSAEPAAVLRKIPYTLLALAISMSAFARFLNSSPHHAVHWVLFTLGAAGLIGAAIGATYRAAVRDGIATFRGEWRRSRSVDLRQLVSVTVPDRQRNRLAGAWFLILEDASGNAVRMSFYRTSPQGRQRLLAALDPYVRGPAVRQEGPVDEAMTGRLWWPYPRRQSPAAPKAA
jgi:hypothetical protein